MPLRDVVGEALPLGADEAEGLPDAAGEELKLAVADTDGVCKGVTRAVALLLKEPLSVRAGEGVELADPPLAVRDDDAVGDPAGEELALALPPLGERDLVALAVLVAICVECGVGDNDVSADALRVPTAVTNALFVNRDVDDALVVLLYEAGGVRLNVGDLDEIDDGDTLTDRAGECVADGDRVAAALSEGDGNAAEIQTPSAAS
jgi:hypothetical protein